MLWTSPTARRAAGGTATQADHREASGNEALPSRSAPARPGCGAAGRQEQAGVADGVDGREADDVRSLAGAPEASEGTTSERDRDRRHHRQCQAPLRALIRRPATGSQTSRTRHRPAATGARDRERPRGAAGAMLDSGVGASAGAVDAGGAAGPARERADRGKPRPNAESRPPTPPASTSTGTVTRQCCRAQGERSGVERGHRADAVREVTLTTAGIRTCQRAPARARTLPARKGSGC